ncbi:MAG: sulfite exporter TauE/SafE family protein [Alphaproteobacteria bacterium]|nr:sulfite exporter TauE/SafE family protein [Alphaproteobacteria bacterium]
MIALSISFFITAMLYAAVGFGGGSTYSALLVLAETDYRILPSIALLCNLIVVIGGTYKFSRAGHINLRRIAPWIVTSVPAAWLGGYLDIPEMVFIGLLGVSLLIVGMRMLWFKREIDDTHNIEQETINKHRFLPPIIGVMLGLLSGLVGIGGGVFLAPILYLMHWDSARKIAATCSIFILVNSLAGLIGQIMKLSNMALVSDISAYWLLFPAVLIGGQIGSSMGAKHLNPNTLRVMTALLILYVAVRLIWRWWEMSV